MNDVIWKQLNHSSHDSEETSNVKRKLFERKRLRLTDLSAGDERGEKKYREEVELFWAFLFRSDLRKKTKVATKNRSDNRAVQPIISIDVRSVKQDQTNEKGEGEGENDWASDGNRFFRLFLLFFSRSRFCQAHD